MHRRYLDLLFNSLLSGSFSPLSISSKYIWLAADKETAYANNEAVTSATDFSGNARHATASATAEPLYITNAMNGKAVYRFDGSNDALNLVNLSAFTAGEIFIVAKHLTTPALGSSSLWEMSGGSFSTYFPFTDNAAYDSCGTTVRVDGMVVSGALESPFIYNVSSAAGLITNRLNGVVLSNRASNVVSFPATPKIGQNGAGAMKFDVAEFFLSNEVLSATERANFKGYLSSKYVI